MTMTVSIQAMTADWPSGGRCVCIWGDLKAGLATLQAAVQKAL
jgi:hypothetical protein